MIIEKKEEILTELYKNREIKSMRKDGLSLKAGGKFQYYMVIENEVLVVEVTVGDRYVETYKKIFIPNVSDFFNFFELYKKFANTSSKVFKFKSNLRLNSIDITMLISQVNQFIAKNEEYAGTHEIRYF
ncbi:hypothetical protein [Aridibaculum aurantiacum]|uniref:hypothetical protein n=1 Tax=Aridibaculum aurantiacum TaxID=2810307 RepID=UPI001A96C60C|nr:hypothetical protein [Aridibaculum aurantiacum]